MTIKKCDICGKELPFNYNNPHLINGDGYLGDTNEKPFAFDIKIVSFQFNCTNVDICKSCIIDGIREGTFKI